MSARHVVTCFHVVRNIAIGDIARVIYLGRPLDGVVLRKVPTDWIFGSASPFPDIALLDVGEEVGDPVKIDCLVPKEGERVRAFGFPTHGDAGGEDATAIYEDKSFYHEDLRDDFRLVVKNAQFGAGMSGSPLYVRDSGGSRVVGVVTLSSDRFRQQGGLVTPARYLVEHFGDLVHLVLHQPTPEAAPLEVLIPNTRAPRFVEADKRAVADVLKCIDGADAARRLGKMQTALRLAQEALSLVPPNAPASLRARATRAVAVTLAETCGDLDEAKNLADAAAKLDGDPVATGRLDATIARSDRGPQAALAAIAELPPGLSAEIDAMKALYYIELGDEPSARAILSSLPTAESERPRVRRARLTTAVMGKRRDEALRLAEGLVIAAEDDISIAHAVAQTFVHGSVPTEFWPGGFAFWPQPIPESEIVEDPEQPARLRTATRLAEMLLENDELDEMSRGVIEVLKLSSLLYDRTRRAEALEYARELLTP